MSIQVVINGSTYSIPEQGLSPPWGEEMSSLLQAIVTLLNSTVGPSDIALTNFTLANNVSSPANIIGAKFDTNTVRSAIISYSIDRLVSGVEVSEVGQIYITYNSTAGTWDISQNNGGTSGIVFSVTNAGQLQYTSTDMGGAGTQKLKFYAKAFLQT